jgi:hypothetical protein
VNAVHPIVVGKVPDEAITKDTVPVYTFTDIINMCHVKSCKYLKTDTEGHDVIIMQSYLDCVSKGFPLIPKIQFEANQWSDQKQVNNILEKFIKYGYKHTLIGDDMHLILP